MSSATNVAISPVNVKWQIEASEQWDFKNATASGLGGQYVTMNTIVPTAFYAWFDENNTDVDPAPAGKTAIEVNYAAGASPSAIATAFQLAVDGTAGFAASVVGTVVTVRRTAVGKPVAPTVGTTTTVALTICRTGKDFDLGLLQGDIEAAFSPSNFTVVAHQTGVSPRAALFQGFETNEATTTMLETQKSQLEEIYGLYGGSFTPGGGTKVFGVGTSKQGQNLLVDAARLVLRPVNAVSNVDDYNIMLAIPIPDSLVFSGENPRTLSITWQGFLDDQADSRVSALLIGDAAQSGVHTPS